MRKQYVGEFRNLCNGGSSQVWLHFVESAAELDPYLDECIACYKTVFAGPPYFEDYTGKEESFIIPEFRCFAEEGILVFAMIGEEPTRGSMVAFAAAVAADKNEVGAFLEAHRNMLAAPVENYLYMAEVGVLEGFRRQGMGRHLVQARIDAVRANSRFRFTHLIMSTAAKGSNSAGIYERLGARRIEGLIQLVQKFDTKSAERIFLARTLS